MRPVGQRSMLAEHARYFLFTTPIESSGNDDHAEQPGNPSVEQEHEENSERENDQRAQRPEWQGNHASSPVAP